MTRPMENSEVQEKGVSAERSAVVEARTGAGDALRKELDCCAGGFKDLRGTDSVEHNLPGLDIHGPKDTMKPGEKNVVDNRPGSNDEIVINNRPGAHDKNVVANRPGSHDEVTVNNLPGSHDKNVIKDRPNSKDTVVINDGPGSRDTNVINNDPNSHDKIVVNEGPGSKDRTVINNRPGSSDEIVVNERPGANGEVIIHNAPGSHDKITINNGQANVNEHGNLTITPLPGFHKKGGGGGHGHREMIPEMPPTDQIPVGFTMEDQLRRR